MSIIENLESMLQKGTDNAMLRYSLGSAYQKAGNLDDAVTHLAKAVEFDPAYSAAWKLYARTLAESGRTAEASEAYKAGIDIAKKNGDLQAAKEMQVFLRRLEKSVKKE